jgi:D-alanyl-D-alanine carboxypeptidase (penicillin-binding protein 5/6)
MLKKITALVIMLSFTVQTFAQTPPPQIDASSAVLMEAQSGKILFEQNGDTELPPASVTKVMTLLLIYESVNEGKLSWDDEVSVSEHAASMGGSQIFLEPNEVQTVADLTKSIAIASANDAAVAMAEKIGGSEDGFVQMMNSKAAELGMKNTHFVNACGLDTDGHEMSAKDIAIMSRELITKYPQIKDYTTTWQDTITHITSKGKTEFGLTNTNKLIKWYANATGLKTGSTGKAKYCLSGTAEKDGMELIAVVMAAPDPKVRFREVIKMFDYGFGNYEVKKGEPKGKKVGSVSVKKGMTESVDAIVSDDVTVLTEKGKSGELKNDIKLNEYVTAPVKQGDKIGEIIYYSNDEEVGKSDLIADKNVEKAGFFKNLKNLISAWM